MQDTKDFDRRAGRPIENEIFRTGDGKFAKSGDAAGPTLLRQGGETFRTGPQTKDESPGGGDIVVGDKGEDGLDVRQCRLRPANDIHSSNMRAKLWRI